MPSPDDVLEELRAQVDPETAPVATAPEIATDLPVGRRAVLDKLRLLEAAGEVGSKSVGAHATVWWPLPSKEPSTEPSKEPTTEQEPAETPSEEPSTAPSSENQQSEREPSSEPSAGLSKEPSTELSTESDAPLCADPDDVPPDVREAVDRAAEYWGDDGRLDDRREATRVVLSAIESEAGLTKSEIVDRYADEYAVEGQTEETWWRRNLAEGAEGAEAPAPLKLVAEYVRATHKWRWTGLDEE
jgi:hypothetical protein